MTTSDSQRVVVIGGGLGGLAAAATLAARGYAVTLVEKSTWLGGKAAQLDEAGFRFDMGPTILTIPGVLKRIFDEAGRPIENYLDLRRLDPQWRCFFADGSVLDLGEDEERDGEDARRLRAGLVRRLSQVPRACRTDSTEYLTNISSGSRSAASAT